MVGDVYPTIDLLLLLIDLVISVGPLHGSVIKRRILTKQKERAWAASGLSLIQEQAGHHLVTYTDGSIFTCSFCTRA